jgi:FAD/FMN-containing dehydrogenase
VRSELLTRREFIASGALATLACGVVGCGSRQSGSAPRAKTHIRPAVPAAAPTPASTANWAALAATLSGRLVLPDDSAYGSAQLVYDLRFEGAHPAAIAFCASPVDVQRVLDFARSHAIQPIPRCGGHSYAGYSTGSGLIVDVTPMNSVTVASSTAGPLATVGAGARLIDLYAATANAGVLVPGGSCPTVGIAGLALGGGIGVVGRRYGLTCDQTQSVEVVTADSRVLTATPTSEPDLYWACRGGGGGNFGIVTSFDFSAYPIPPLVLFDLQFPWGAAGDLLGAWQTWVASAPDELWSNCMLVSAGGAGLAAKATGVYAGEAATLNQLLSQLIATVGTQATSKFVASNSYLTAMLVEAGCSDLTLAQCHLPTLNPAGTLSRTTFVAKSQYVSTPFPPSALTVATDAMELFQRELPAVGGSLAVDSYGGAINAVPADATAFVHRDALCQIQLAGALAGPLNSTILGDVQSWLAQTADALAPYCNGQAYQNYIDPTLDDWEQAYYGANLGRLIGVKHAYDPDDVFHFAQSIPTSL